MSSTAQRQQATGGSSGSATVDLLQREVDRLSAELGATKSENNQLREQVQYLSHLLYTKRNNGTGGGGGFGVGATPSRPGLFAPGTRQEGKCVVVDARTGEVHTDDEA